MRLSGLRVRLLLLVLVAGIPALALILYTAAEQRRTAVADVQHTALRLARLVSAEQGQRIAGARDLLIALASLRDVRGDDRRACAQLFRRLLDEYPLYVNLGAADADGKVFCSALPLPAPTNIADRAYFRRALTTRSFAVGDFQIGRITGVASLNVGYPIITSGQIDGIVFAAISLEALNSLVVAARLPSGSTFTIVDRQGTILVRHPDAERWVGQSASGAEDLSIVRMQRNGTAEASGLDGVPRLFGFSPLLDTGEAGDVYVSVGIPRQAAVEAANRLLTRNLLALVVVAVLAFGGAWVASDVFVLRRVHAVLRATRRLASGDLFVRLGGPYRGEIGQVARAFDEMAEALERRTAEREAAQREAAQQQAATFRSEKLAALGRLAAGVVHELRNPLMVVTGRAQALQQQAAAGTLPPADALSRQLTSLGDAAQHMERIIEGLSAYSRPVRPQPTALTVGDLLHAVENLVSFRAKQQGVTLVIDVPDRPLAVSGDRSQFLQILLNLATNGIEAMAGTAGTLTLRARRSGPPPGTPGDEVHVVIEVVDTGPGIPADRLERIWEAFYTTKAEGTGLGLSIVSSLVKEQPRTSITVDSAPGRGTTFRLTAPAVSTTT